LSPVTWLGLTDAPKVICDQKLVLGQTGNWLSCRDSAGGLVLSVLSTSIGLSLVPLPSPSPRCRHSQGRRQSKRKAFNAAKVRDPDASGRFGIVLSPPSPLSPNARDRIAFRFHDLDHLAPASPEPWFPQAGAAAGRPCQPGRASRSPTAPPPLGLPRPPASRHCVGLTIELSSLHVGAGCPCQPDRTPRPPTAPPPLGPLRPPASPHHVCRRARPA
jgi:hypothetical protein